MKRYSWLLIFCHSLFAQGIFDSQAALEQNLTDINAFYEEYVFEQAQIDGEVGLGTPGSGPFHPPALPPAPPNPPTPDDLPGHLPFVIVNNSGFDDDKVWITIIGAKVSGIMAEDQKMYVTFDGEGAGSYVDVTGTGDVPNVALSMLPMLMGHEHTRVFYIPADDNGSDGISGGRIYFQVNNDTTIITYKDDLLREPSVTNQTDPGYSVPFDKYEFAYIPNGSPQIAANATAVDFFGIPLYGYLSTPDEGSSGNSGLYVSQSFVMSQVVPYFFDNKCTGAFKSAILAQWNNLLAPNRAHPIRVLAPGMAMSVGTASSFPNKFDPNYFDNAAAYGFSLLQYLWSGSNSYYKNHGLYFAIPPSASYDQPGICSSNGVSGVYTASIASNNVMHFCPPFTSDPDQHFPFFPAPSTAHASEPSPINGPTTYLIFSAQNLNHAFAANLQGNQVSKLFEEAMIAGLLPAPFSPSNPLSNGYLTANAQHYFSNSANLPLSAGGPWYSLYSEAIHYCGTIYAYGFDEPLYPNVLMQCTTPTEDTFIGITIGPCDLVPQ